MHDMKTGKPIVKERGPQREKFHLTPANAGYKAPCFTGYKCPKGTPATEHEHILSAKNRRVLMLYHQARATGFQFAPHFDALLADNFAIVDGMVRDFERQEQTEAVTEAFERLRDTIRGA